MVELDAIAVGGLFLAFVALIASAWAVRAQLQEQVFLQYTERYQRILGSLPLGALELGFETESLDNDPSRRDEIFLVIHQYFDLCSEEVKLKKRSRIPRRVWKDWEEGILSAMKGPLCQLAWRDGVFAGGYETLRRFLENRTVPIPRLAPR